MFGGMTQAKTLLIIDDDPDLRELLSEQLCIDGEFSVTTAKTAAEGLQTAKQNHPDLILLDVDLPDSNGRDVCRALREAGIVAPVVMLTAAVADTDTIAGLEAGASDYVTKPFKFNVLLARIRAQLRNHEQSQDAVLHIGPYEFRPSSKILVDDKGRKLRLTDKEANILRYLFRAGARAISREELLAEVWGYNAGVTTHTLETHVYRLRQKIEQPEHPPLLITEAGGYRLAP